MPGIQRCFKVTYKGQKITHRPYLADAEYNAALSALTYLRQLSRFVNQKWQLQQFISIWDAFCLQYAGETLNPEQKRVIQRKYKTNKFQWTVELSGWESGGL